MCCRISSLKAELGGGYDMVVANIVADVIIGLSGQVRPFLKEDGLFLCSGIIDDRAEEVARQPAGSGMGHPPHPPERGLVLLSVPVMRGSGETTAPPMLSP